MGRGWSTARRFATRFPDFGHANAYCGPMVSQWNSEYGLVVSIGLVLAFLFTVDGLRSVRSRLPKKLPVVANALLSRAEQVLYGRLVRAFPGHVVLAQVALSQLLMVDRAQAGSSAQAIRNRFNQLVADFVICAPDFSALAVVELDDRSHNREPRREQDQRKDAFVQAAGLKMIRVSVADLPNEAALKALMAVVPAASSTAQLRTVSRSGAHSSS
jgi:very-short-patch-repair endonuclease